MATALFVSAVFYEERRLSCIPRLQRRFVRLKPIRSTASSACALDTFDDNYILLFSPPPFPFPALWAGGGPRLCLSLPPPPPVFAFFFCRAGDSFSIPTVRELSSNLANSCVDVLHNHAEQRCTPVIPQWKHCVVDLPLPSFLLSRAFFVELRCRPGSATLSLSPLHARHANLSRKWVRPALTPPHVWFQIAAAVVFFDSNARHP